MTERLLVLMLRITVHVGDVMRIVASAENKDAITFLRF